MRKLLAIFVILFSFLIPAYAENRPKDVVLVVDISKSMIGIGNRGEITNNIFDDVKKRLQVFVNNLNEGDSVYFILFGTDVYDTKIFDIKEKSEVEQVRSYVAGLRATDQLTYTSKMLERLTTVLNDIGDKSTKKVQLSVIFTDAIDDPPSGKEKVDVSNVTQSLENNKTNNGYVYYFSLNPNISQKLKGVIASYFPGVILYNVDSDNQLSVLTQEAIDNLKPTIQSSLTVKSYKPFESRTFPIYIEANKEAAGLDLNIDIQQGPEAYLKLEPDSLKLKEGTNTVNLVANIPIRFGGDWNAALDFKIDTILDSIIKPANPVDVNLSIIPLSIKEKFTHLPEYYVTAILLLILILVGLYFLIKYLTFVPLLEIHYWLTAENEPKQAKSSKFDPLTFEVERNTLNLIETENGNYLVSADAEAETPPFIHLEELSKYEPFNLVVSGEKRTKKVRVAKEDKMKLTGKKNAGGKFLRNKSYFRVGKYSFVVKTNLK